MVELGGAAPAQDVGSGLGVVELHIWHLMFPPLWAARLAPRVLSVTSLVPGMGPLPALSGPEPPPVAGTHLLDSANQVPVAEENDHQRDHEVNHKHVDDERFIVDLWLQSVIVNPARALHALGDVPARRAGQISAQRRAAEPAPGSRSPSPAAPTWTSRTAGERRTPAP